MIGQTIKNLRRSKKLSQTEFAKIVGVSQTTVTAWETGKADPSSLAIIRIADYFGVTADYLLGRSKKENDTDSIDYTELERALDNAKTFDGKPMSDNDREVVRNILKGYFITH